MGPPVYAKAGISHIMELQDPRTQQPDDLLRTSGIPLEVPADCDPLEPRIIHRDERLLVVLKPAGLLSVPGIGAANADCLVRRLQRSIPSARIVHRLDQATSGVMVLALDADAHRDLSRQFERRSVHKEYLAVVAGRVQGEEGLIDLPMRKDMERKARHLIDHRHGKPALTRFSVQRRGSEHTLLRLRPETGRSHQIRLHLASIGHPILGDDIYAPPAIAEAAPRLMLHAAMLAFDDPQTGRRMAFAALGEGLGERVGDVGPPA